MTRPGLVNLPVAGKYTFSGNADNWGRLYIDDTLVWSHWKDEADVTGVAFNNATASATHRIRIEYRENTGPASISINWTPPGGISTVIPQSALTPGYGLATSTTVDDNTYGAATTQTTYSNPAYSLRSAVVQDPAGHALTTQTASEAPTNTTGYIRQLSKTLPAGNTTNYAYYADTEAPVNPCGGPAVNRGAE